MSTELLIAILGFLGTACGSTVGAITSTRLITYRLEQLENKVDKLSDTSQRIALLEQKDMMNDKRITALENKAQEN